MKHLFVLTDQPVLGVGVDATLRQAGDWITITAEYSELSAALSKAKPDVVLVDLVSGNFNLLIDIQRVVSECKLVLWIHNIEIETAFQAIRLGVRGILRKTDSLEAMRQCLETVVGGQLWLDKALASGVTASRCIQLTVRESQLVSLISNGLKNKEIAAHLCISEATVRIYMSNLFRKVGAKDRYELALYGLKNMAGSYPIQSDDAAQTLRPLSFMISKPPAREIGAGLRRAKRI